MSTNTLTQYNLVRCTRRAPYFHIGMPGCSRTTTACGVTPAPRRSDSFCAVPMTASLCPKCVARLDRQGVAVRFEVDPTYPHLRNVMSGAADQGVQDGR